MGVQKIAPEKRHLNRIVFLATDNETLALDKMALTGGYKDRSKMIREKLGLEDAECQETD